MYSADDLVMCLGVFNGHIAKHIDGVHGGYVVGQRNFEGRVLLVLSGDGIVCVIYMV